MSAPPTDPKQSNNGHQETSGPAPATHTPPRSREPLTPEYTHDQIQSSQTTDSGGPNTPSNEPEDTATGGISPATRAWRRDIEVFGDAYEKEQERRAAVEAGYKEGKSAGDDELGPGVCGFNRRSRQQPNTLVMAAQEEETVKNDKEAAEAYFHNCIIQDAENWGGEDGTDGA